MVQAAKRYDSYDLYGSILSVEDFSDMPFELVRFKYGGEWWGGVRFFHDNTGPNLVRLTGTGTDTPFFDVYYNRQTSTILNQEIYDSITTDGVVPVGPLRFNGVEVSGGGGLGVGQTWQNLTGSRIANTTYTNTTGKPIEVYIVISDAGQEGYEITIGNITTSYNNMPNLAQNIHSFIIPDGVSYRVTPKGNTISYWLELR